MNKPVIPTGLERRCTKGVFPFVHRRYYYQELIIRNPAGKMTRKVVKKVLTNKVVNGMLYLTRKVVKFPWKRLKEPQLLEAAGGMQIAIDELFKGTPLQAGDQPDGAGEAGGRVQADHQPD